MTAITQALSAALIHFVWQGAIVGSLLWATLFALRKRTANVRYLVSCAALAILAVLPVVSAAVLYLRTLPADSAANVATGVSTTITAALTGSNVQRTEWLRWLQLWTLPVWSFGVFLFSIRFLLGWKHAFGLGRRGAPAQESVLAMVSGLARRMGVNRSVRVLISGLTDGPSVVGWIRPVILLPVATMVGLTPEQLEAVLAHELAHIRRHDYLINMLQMGAETLFFYHPAVWWASRRIRIERELCCDDLAVRSCGDALCYARALTALEKLRVTTPTLAPLAMASAGGPLLHRIQRVLGVRTAEYTPSRLPGLVAICLGLACFALNVNWVRAQEQGVRVHEEPEVEASATLDFPGVHVDLGSASVIHRTSVQYPENVMQQGVRGTVNVEVSLDRSGIVSDARILSGPEELRKSVLQSVLNWHFTHDAAGSTRQISVAFEPPPAGSEPGSGVFTKAIASSSEAVYENQVFQYEPAEPLKAVFFTHAVGPIEANVSTNGGANPERDDATFELKADTFLVGSAGKMLTDPKGNPLRPEFGKQIEILRNGQEEGGVNSRRLQPFEVGNLEGQTDEGKLTGVRGGFSIAMAKPIVMAGRTLQAIGTPGLSESVRNDLLSKLPVRVGDVLSHDSIEAISPSAREFDEHLSVHLVPTHDGQAELQIVAPGSEVGWRVFRK